MIVANARGDLVLYRKTYPLMDECLRMRDVVIEKNRPRPSANPSEFVGSAPPQVVCVPE